MDAIDSEGIVETAKQTTSSALKLNINVFRKNGKLSEGNWGILEIVGEGYQHTIGFRTGESEIELFYSVSGTNQSITKYCYCVPIVWTQCNYGGVRPWFACPRCTRRCAILYAGKESNQFQCRTCQKLCYQSQLEGKFGRAILRLSHYGAVLGSRGHLLTGLPIIRPRYMHHKRFFLLMAAASKQRENFIRYAPFNPLHQKDFH